MSKKKKLYAEDLPYWRTGTKYNQAIDEAVNALNKYGAEISMNGQFSIDGVKVIAIQFKLDGDEYRLVERIILPRKRSGTNDRAAEIQAAAALKHNVKSRLNQYLRNGARNAFMSALILPNGRVAHEESNIGLQRLLIPPAVNALGDGVIDGEWTSD